MPRIPMEDQLCDFILQFTSDECSREVLQLLGRHPYTRLNRLAIQHALDWRSSAIDQALDILISRRVVKTGIENETVLYRLTDAEPTNRLAQRVASLDCSQWRTLMRLVCIPKITPVFRSTLNAGERAILSSVGHKSAFVFPVIPR